MREQTTQRLSYIAFFGYFLGETRKYRPRQGTERTMCKNKAIVKAIALFFLLLRATIVLLLQKEVLPCAISFNVSAISFVRQT